MLYWWGHGDKIATDAIKMPRPLGTPLRSSGNLPRMRTRRNQVSRSERLLQIGSHYHRPSRAAALVPIPSSADRFTKLIDQTTPNPPPIFDQPLDRVHDIILVESQ
jgi:hypothetical protein